MADSEINIENYSRNTAFISLSKASNENLVNSVMNLNLNYLRIFLFSLFIFDSKIH